MSIPGKVLIALLSALAVSAASGLIGEQLTFATLFLPTAAAALLAVLLSHRALPLPSGLARDAEAAPRAAAEQKSPATKKPAKAEKKPDARKTSAAASGTETGTVKWFNASKGFGFIIRDNGEEIFVHHRSIQGEGRGSLRDGGAVNFRVVTTDKGPQAEDVEPLD